MSEFEEKSSAHTGAIKIMRQVLRERKEAVENNPDLIITNLKTQSGIYYRARPRYIAAGIDPSKQGKLFRQNQTRIIANICEEMGVTREEIGIFAQERTFLYFRGQKFSVGFKNLEELMQKGTDIILIEKEGMAEVLRPYADAAGIAILNSIGFVVEYASRLARSSKNLGAHIAMVTDFDVSGLSMSRDLPWIHRIGIDFSTLDYFGLASDDIEEDYDTTKPTRRTEKTAYRHWKGLLNKGAAKGQSQQEFEMIMEYLRQKRIELDSVVEQVGNKAFWDYIVGRLTAEFPTRNYNRAIKVPDYIIPDELQDLNIVLLERIRDELEDDVEKTKDKLEDVKGIIRNVDKKESRIEKDFKKLITTSTRFSPILKKIQKLADQLR